MTSVPETSTSDKADSCCQRLAVVIINYRTAKLVIDCLASLSGEVVVGRHDVIVVDNCSGDDSAARISHQITVEGWDKWARVLYSPVNGGFSAGNNLGIKAATDADVILLLNSDTIVRPGAISKMLQTLSEHPELHLVGPRLEWPDGTYQVSTFRQRTPLTELIASSQLGLIARMLPRHVVAREQHEFTTNVDWVSFACVAIRRDVVDRVGFLDETYFMYFEDMAYCTQLRKAGFRIAYQPDARVVHLRGGSSPVKELTRQRKRRPKYFYEARSYYFKSCFGAWGLFAANLLWTLGWLIGTLRGRTGAVEHEHVDIGRHHVLPGKIGDLRERTPRFMPDFLVIGAMKCATSTLHEQLALQPGISMSEPKEPNFFSMTRIGLRELAGTSRCSPRRQTGTSKVSPRLITVNCQPTLIVQRESARCFRT